MNVSVFQYATVWMDLRANLDVIEDQCHSLAGRCDLLILPEMFSTGYTMSPQLISLEWQEITLRTLQNLSTKHNITIAGTIPMFKHGYWYNTFIVVNATGLIYQYDKIHLFTLAGETEVYKPGNECGCFEMNGWKIFPLVCYDLRFPYLTITNNPPDLIIYSANWPAARIHHWRSLLIARAIENQCFVLGVNRTGVDANGYIYSGNSMLIDFNGKVMEMLGENAGTMTLSLDKNEMSRYREKLPFLGDRRKDY